MILSRLPLAVWSVSVGVCVFVFVSVCVGGCVCVCLFVCGWVCLWVWVCWMHLHHDSTIRLMHACAAHSTKPCMHTKVRPGSENISEPMRSGQRERLCVTHKTER
jgi:hypothetical protein